MISMPNSMRRPWPKKLLSAKGLLTAFLLLTLLTVSVSAFAGPRFPNLDNRRVIDEAELLSPEAEAKLTQRLADLEATTTDQMVVVTVKSLEGEDIADYGYQLGRHWGIGQSGKVSAENGQTYKDNGLILIVAPNERKVRIEVGYGLEPVVTDAYSSLVIREAIVPAFRENQYELGINQGSERLINHLLQDRQIAIKQAQAISQDRNSVDDIPPWLIILGFIILVILVRSGILPWYFFLGGGGGGGGGWSGGGGFSGGGGSFGGGGSSGSW